jgi:hypothetical protein
VIVGALHVHSTYSDGEFTLAELRDAFLAAGCRFVCLADHSQWFDAASLEAYRAECRARSDDEFCFVPGLEYPCVGRMHIVGLGATEIIDSTDPGEVIAGIARLGGISYVAHPRDDAFPVIEALDPLPDGIEVWNSKYDGRYAPRPGTFALLERLRSRRENLLAFYGQDLHWRRQFRGLTTGVDSSALESGALLAAIRRGAYTGLRGDLQLPSDGAIPEATIGRFARANARSQQMRWLVGRAKVLADRSGLMIPKSMKAQLRRIF